MIGQEFLHYKILEKLGEGGMGVVYKAADQKLERTVAVKFLPAHVISDEEGIARFQNEAKAAARLNHPNITTIFAIEETGDKVFFVMELIEGNDLGSIISKNRNSPLPIPEILNYATQMAEGIRSAHENGVVHRDIKSSNIMVTGTGLVKIMDFGLAKSKGHKRLTKSGTTMGTLGYISPEQLLGEEVDQRTDIWAFGVVLYELLTGQLPFQNSYEQAIIYAIMHKDPVPVSEMRQGVPASLSEIVHRALQKDRQDRYASMNEVVEALQGITYDSGANSFSSGPRSAASMKVIDRQKGSLLTEGERRHVTMVVSYISGYDSLLENLELEEVNQVIETIERQVEEVVRGYEGIINHFSEEEIVILFGIPFIHEDDVSRAIWTTFKLNEVIQRVNQGLSRKIGRGIHAHTGIDAGLMVVHSREGSGMRYKLTGEPSIVATRLAEEAGDGEVLISSKSGRRVKPFFKTASLGASLKIRGRAAPVQPLVIKGDSGLDSQIDIFGDSKLTPFTGREREVGILRDALNDALAGEGQFITLMAEAGVGKSRLLYEFRSQLGDDVELLQGSCHLHARNIPYFPFIGLLKALFDLNKNGEQEQVDAVVTRALTLDPNLKAYLPHILQLLSLASVDFHLPEDMARGIKQRLVIEGLSAIVTQEATHRPIVILLEDWHWVDNESQAVLQQLVELVSGFPICLVVTYRPDVAFDWGNPSNHQQIRLAPLGDESALQIVKSVLDAESLPRSLEKLIQERTGGNPLFIEELTQALQEGNLIKVEGRKVVLTDSKNKIDVPHTIQSVIRTRLDRLDRDAQVVLRVAAVIGREFAHDVLESALENSLKLQPAIKALRDLGLIRQTRIVPEVVYQFKHILTKEVVYDSLLKRQRKSLHGKIGEILEARSDDLLGDQNILLMEHFSKSENWEKAIYYGLRAAENPMLESFSAMLRTMETVEQWVLNLTESKEREGQLVQVLLKMERICEYLGDLKRQRVIIDRLLGLLGPENINRAEAYIRLGDLYLLSNRLNDAEMAFNEAFRLSQALEFEKVELRVMRSIGYLKVNRGQDEEAASIVQEVIRRTKLSGGGVLLPDLNSLFTILLRIGNLEGAKKCLDEALEIFGEGRLNWSGYIHLMAGNYYRQTGELQKAIDHFTSTVKYFESGNITGKPSTALIPLAHIHLMQGEVDTAIEYFERSIATCRAVKNTYELANSLQTYGTALSSLGRYTDALPIFEEAVQTYNQLEDFAAEMEALCTVANLKDKQGELSSALSIWEKVLEMSEENNDLRTRLRAVKGIAHTMRGLSHDTAKILQQYQKAMDLAVMLKDVDEQGDILNTMGIIAWKSSEYEKALDCYEAALDIFRQIENKKNAGFILNSIAATLIKLDRYEEALTRIEEAIEMHKHAGIELLEGHALALRGDCYFALEDFDQSQKNYAASMEIRRRFRDNGGEGWLCLSLAKVSRAKGEETVSQQYIHRAMTIARTTGDAALLAQVEEYI